jgi:hypothetical protein
MFSADVLTFREFMMREDLPIAAVHNAVFEFLRGRHDVVMFGAQAVNAYVNEARMTEDVDVLATNAEELAEELRVYLSDRFHIATRVRRVADGRGYRVFQVRKSGNRHLVDVRSVEALPAAERVADVLVIAPADLVALKVSALYQRRGQPKSGTDWRDVAMLLLAFPDLKQELGPVGDRLRATGASPEVLDVWKDLVAQEIRPEGETEEF